MARYRLLAPEMRNLTQRLIYDEVRDGYLTHIVFTIRDEKDYVKACEYLDRVYPNWNHPTESYNLHIFSRDELGMEMRKGSSLEYKILEGKDKLYPYIDMDWVTIMRMVEYLFELGYLVSMLNHKRWLIDKGDNLLFYGLPDICIDVRGNKSNMESWSNMKVCAFLLNVFLERWQELGLEERTVTHSVTQKNVTLSLLPFCRWTTKKD